MSGEFGAALAKNTKKKMPQAELEAYIRNLLGQVRIAVLSTTNGEKPRATPLEYFMDGMTIYISPDNGVKMKNIRVNPNVSLAVCNALKVDWEKQWDKVWGMQITGLAEVFEHGCPEWERAREIIDVSSYLRALGLKETRIGTTRTVLRIPIRKVELWDDSLLHKGYTYRQVWAATRG